MQIVSVERNNTMSNTINTASKYNAIWADDACITSGAYVIEETGWWSEDGSAWYGVESDEAFDSSKIVLIGGPADGKIIG
jgi:hypothetical protein